MIKLQNYSCLPREINNIDTQVKINTRNIELEDKQVRQLCCDYQKELRFLWKSDPDRQEIEIYGSEVRTPNKECQKAVIRDFKSEILTGVSAEYEVKSPELETKWIGFIT
jgi:hypothetical protein